MKSLLIGIPLVVLGLVGLVIGFLHHRALYTISFEAVGVLAVSFAGFVLVHDGLHFIREAFA